MLLLRNDIQSKSGLYIHIRVVSQDYPITWCCCNIAIHYSCACGDAGVTKPTVRPVIYKSTARTIVYGPQYLITISGARSRRAHPFY